MKRAGSIVMKRLGMGLEVAAFVVGSALSAVAQTSTPSAVEKLYADLAKLPAAERTKAIEDGARREGSLVLVHTLRGDLGNGHIDLFRKRYPFVKVEATADIGSQDAAERLFAEETSNRHLTDVISIGMPDAAEVLRKDFVARYPTPAADKLTPNFKKYADPEHRWLLFFWSEHGISYNSNLVPPEKAPKDWFDLCDPFFKGSVSFDPAETRFISGLWSILGEEKLVKFMECMGQNNPIIQRGHTQRMELMLAGDHMAQGDNYLYQGLVIQKKNPAAPYKIVFSAPMIASTGGSLINRQAPHPYAAALFLDWSVSDESQKYISEQYRGPVTLKHPYLPDDVNLVDNVDPPKETADRLLALWLKHVEKKK